MKKERERDKMFLSLSPQDSFQRETEQTSKRAKISFFLFWNFSIIMGE